MVLSKRGKAYQHKSPPPFSAFCGRDGCSVLYNALTLSELGLNAIQLIQLIQLTSYHISSLAFSPKHRECPLTALAVRVSQAFSLHSLSQLVLSILDHRSLYSGS